MVDIGNAFATGAVRVREAPEGPAFWYASNEPGPFYVWGERVLMDPQVDKTIALITRYLSAGLRDEVAVTKILDLILARYHQTASYRSAIRSMIGLIPASTTIDCISGGERRDWLFSVPMAVELGIPHVWLFKSNAPLVTDTSGGRIHLGSRVCCAHASELLNRGESFIRYWFAGLETLGLRLNFACFALDRSSGAINYLRDRRIDYGSLHTIDGQFFEGARRLGLISDWALDEVLLYLRSPNHWIAERFLPFFPRNARPFRDDPKSGPRIEAFCRERGLAIPEAR
jgi:orotate phosphoribosyltransferase